MKLKYPLILASNSPRRQQLLRDLGIHFTIITQSIEEVFPSDLALNQIPEFLAKQKAEAFKELSTNEMLLTADTIVTLQNKILGKPQSEKHAALMLSDLSGKTHQVYTGVCLRLHNNFHTFITQQSTAFFDYSIHASCKKEVGMLYREKILSLSGVVCLCLASERLQIKCSLSPRRGYRGKDAVR